MDCAAITHVFSLDIYHLPARAQEEPSAGLQVAQTHE